MSKRNGRYGRRLAIAGAALLLAGHAVGGANGYSFTPVASLGDAAPGGGGFTFDFEISGINSRGEVAFVADVTTGGEGVFLGRAGVLSLIARTGLPAPGGGVFAAGELGRLGFNEGGDAAFAFTLEPLSASLVANSGVYRFSHSDQKLSAVVVPNVTPAPGGGIFIGANFNSGMNNSGDIVFGGVLPGASGTLDFAVFRADKRGNIVRVAGPGDPAPGGGKFDLAQNPSINDGGDIAFGGHVAGEPQVPNCPESVYLKPANGTIQSIAHQGDPAPGGGFFRCAFGGVINNRGDIVFIGDLTPPPASVQNLGVFLFSHGAIIPVARPGDPMPGGGKLLTAGTTDASYSINNRGDVSFSAALDTDVNGDGIPDTGVYVLSNGSLRLVARTGTVIPGLGTIAYLGIAPFCLVCTQSGGVINDHGEVLFSATFDNGKSALLVAAR